MSVDREMNYESVAEHNSENIHHIMSRFRSFLIQADEINSIIINLSRNEFLTKQLPSLEPVPDVCSYWSLCLLMDSLMAMMPILN